MEALFTTKSKMTFEEYKKYNIAVLIKIRKIPLWLAIEAILLILLAIISSQIIFIIAAIVVPIIITLVLFMRIKKTYKSYTVDLSYKYDFYADYLEQKSELNTNKLPYNQIYKIIETKTNFYIMISNNQAHIIIKDNCSPELIDFIRTIK